MKKHLNGFTLIEILITLVTSLIIIAGLTSIFLTLQSNFRTQQAFQTVQYHSQLAHQFLQNDIRLAGYWGCISLAEQEFLIRFKNDYGDVVTVKHASTTHANLIKTMQGQSVLYLTASPTFSKEDLLIISNCHHAEIFIVKNVTILKDGIQKITTLKPLLHRYIENDEVSFFEINTYFINKTKRQDETGKPIYALYLKDNHGQVNELVEGINNMNINYILRKNNVVAVDVALLLTSLNQFSLTQELHTLIPLRDRVT